MDVPRTNPRPQVRYTALQQGFWRSLPDWFVEQMQSHGVLRKFQDGAVLVQRGDPQNSLLVITSGRVRSVIALRGGEEQLLRWMEAGETVAVGSVIAGLPFPTTLIASNNCEVLSIPGPVFLKAISADADICLKVARFLASRLNEMADLMTDQSQIRLSDRLRAWLIYVAAENGNPLPGGRKEIRMTQQDMAGAIGASRQRLNEALQDLRRAGSIEIEYGRVIVLPDAITHPQV